MELQKIHYDALGADVRILLDQSKNVWFVAKDIEKMLDLKNINQYFREMPKGVYNTYPLETEGGSQKLTIVSEGGLYRLIFKSRKPEAEKFVTWVTEEVLPQIRKTGGYSLESRPNNPALPVEYHLDIAERLGRVGFSRGVQQAYLLEQDQRIYDETASHLLPELARLEAQQEVAKITYDRSLETNFACRIPVASFRSLTVSEIARKFKDKRVSTKTINEWLCQGGFQKRIARGKYLKLRRGEETAVTHAVYEGSTAGMDIIQSWRYTAEVQQYLEGCYKKAFQS